MFKDARIYLPFNLHPDVSSVCTHVTSTRDAFLANLAYPVASIECDPVVFTSFLSLGKKSQC